RTMRPEGYQFPKGTESAFVLADVIDERYLETMNVKLLEGRGFLETDSPTAPKVVIVNKTLAKKYWPGQGAIGKRMRLGEGQSDWITIVGVVKTGKYIWIAEPPTEFLYLPFRQHPRFHMTLFAQSHGDPQNLASPLREAVRSIDAKQPIYDIRT